MADRVGGASAAGGVGLIASQWAKHLGVTVIGTVGSDDKIALQGAKKPNIGIVSAYNDMLSAHQPLADYPALLKAAARLAGATAQFAGGLGRESERVKEQVDAAAADEVAAGTEANCLVASCSPV